MSLSVFSYDELPYDGGVHSLAHPRRIAAIATLFGVSPEDLRTARVLDIGCGRGDDLIPLAAAYPDAHFVGIDLGDAHVRHAHATATRLGLHNVRFSRMDLNEAGQALRRFDYVIAHGVYSWVPPTVADALLHACAELLSERGIAYISYNVLPGWREPGLVRDALRAHVAGLPTARAKVKATREFLEAMDSNADKGTGMATPYERALRVVAAGVRGNSDSYVFHEFLCEDNHPIHLLEFVARAADHGLRYLGDVAAGAMWGDGAMPEIAAKVAGSRGGRVEREQLLDELTGRTFRHSLVCPVDVPVGSAPRTGALRDVLLSTRLVAEGEGRFRRAAGGALRVARTGTAAALTALAAARGRPIALGPGLLDDDGVLDDLLAIVRAGLVDPVAPGGPGADRIEDRPVAWSYSRALASAGEPCVIGLGHDEFEIDDVGRFLLTRFDGSRTLDQIVHEFRDTSFVDPSSNEDSVRASVAAWLDGALANELLVNGPG